MDIYSYVCMFQLFHIHAFTCIKYIRICYIYIYMLNIGRAIELYDADTVDQIKACFDSYDKDGIYITYI